MKTSSFFSRSLAFLLLINQRCEANKGILVAQREEARAIAQKAASDAEAEAAAEWAAKKAAEEEATRAAEMLAKRISDKIALEDRIVASEAFDLKSGAFSNSKDSPKFRKTILYNIEYMKPVSKLKFCLSAPTSTDSIGYKNGGDLFLEFFSTNYANP